MQQNLTIHIGIILGRGWGRGRGGGVGVGGMGVVLYLKYCNSMWHVQTKGPRSACTYMQYD